MLVKLLHSRNIFKYHVIHFLQYQFIKLKEKKRNIFIMLAAPASLLVKNKLNGVDRETQKLQNVAS